MKEFNLDDIKAVLGNEAEYFGRSDLFFDNVRSLKEVNEKSLGWINSKTKDKASYLCETKAAFVICEKSLEIPDELLKTKTIIKVSSPKMAFAKVATALFSKGEDYLIHPCAQIFPGAKIGKNVMIGPNTVIYSHVEIGDNVIIGANNTIGADGFGYERDLVDKTLYKFPHFGKVIIGNNVEIGNNTCIDRGALSDTLIGDGTKIDNLVHIAHNVRIGKNCCIIANSMIAGSSTVGDHSWVAPNAAIREHISVGKNVLIGLGAVVTKSVEDDQIIAPFPALPFKKMITIFKKLLE